jgi:hypothetical protein
MRWRLQSGLFLLVMVMASAVRPAAGAEYPQVRIETSAGSFVVQLDDGRAPSPPPTSSAMSGTVTTRTPCSTG